LCSSRHRHREWKPFSLQLYLIHGQKRLLTYLNGVQMMLAQAQNASPPAPVNGATSSVPPSPANGVSLTGAIVTIPSRNPSLRLVSEYLFRNDFRAWLVVVGTFSILCMLLFGLPLYGIWFIIISSTWSAQIIRNVYQRTRRVVRHDTVIFSSILRLFTPLCRSSQPMRRKNNNVTVLDLFACPDNLLSIEPARMSFR